MQDVCVARDADELRDTRLVKELLSGKRLPAVGMPDVHTGAVTLLLMIAATDIRQ